MRGSRLQNLHRRTAAANSNFPATILSSNSAGSNFAYALIPQEPPPPYPGSPTSTDGGSNNNNNDFSNFVAPQLTQPQPQAQQAPVSSHEYPTQDQQAPHGTYSYAPFYPEQPAATESEGITSDTTPLLHQESDDNDDSNPNINVVGPQDHLEAQLPDVTVTVDLSAPETVPGTVPPSDSDSKVLPSPPPPSDPAEVADNMRPPTAAGQVESYPKVADGDSDTNPQLLPPSN